MGTTDYIPADDVSLDSFADNFAATIGGSEANFGLVVGDTTALATVGESFSNAMMALDLAKNAQQVARATKDTARTELVTKLRSLTRQVQATPSLTDAQRLDLQITVRDTTPTSVAAPTTQPVLFVGTGNRLQHSIQFRDALTPLSTAKPLGVHGVEIFRKIGAPAPLAVADCEFIALDTATPYTAQYGSESGGLMVYYLARWATRSGLTGPISDLISATVVA